MLAGLARIVEICFIAPTEVPGEGQEDSNSEHTLTESPRYSAPFFAAGSPKASASKAFRHLPPFVSSQRLDLVANLFKVYWQLLIAAG
jgi:hypothetical protein